MRVVIAGAGNVGTFIAEDLVKAGHQVTLVESDANRVEALQGLAESKDINWLVADACELSQLAKASPESADVVAAVTGDDEDNLVISLLAKQEFAVPRVVARVNHPKNQWLFNETWGVDVAVSTPHLLTALVEEAVTVGSLVRLLSLEGDKARLSEARLTAASPANGVDIVSLALPREASVVAIVRKTNVIVPRGDTVLHDGDEVLILTAPEVEEDVVRILLG